MGTIVHTQQELDAALAGCAGDIIIDSPGGVLLRVGGYGKVWRVGGESCVDVGGSATIQYVGDSATIQYVGGSATIQYVGDSATIRDVGGSATIHTYGGTVANASPYVAVHLHSAHAKVTGGTLIDLTALDMNDPATWCDYHGVRVSGGSAYLAKCVSLDFMAGQGNIPTRYPVDATVTAADWDPHRACGNGLHFSPTPAAARALYQGDLRSGFRFVECEVDLASMVVLGNKVKAPSCRVVREIGLDR